MEHLRPIFGLPMFPSDKATTTEVSTTKDLIFHSSNKVRHLHGNRKRPSKQPHFEDQPEMNVTKVTEQYEMDAFDNELRMARDNDFEKVSKITYAETSASRSFVVQINPYVLISLPLLYKQFQQFIFWEIQFPERKFIKKVNW